MLQKLIQKITSQKNRQNKKVGFTCGAFDLLHAGHALMFKECKEHCDYLIVGLQHDPSVDRDYKNAPIQTIEERLIMLESIKYVDEIYQYKTEKDLYALLKSLTPDVRIVGYDWLGKKFTGHDLPIHVVFNSRNHNFSSSELRNRVYEAEMKKQS